MDPLAWVKLGEIRQQEILEQAAHYRNSRPIWERFWKWSATLRRKRAAAPAQDEHVVSTGMMIENC